MITVDGTAQAAIDANARGVAVLVDLDIVGGMLRFTTWPADIVTGGNTFAGVGGLVSLDGLSESEDRSARKVVMSFTLVNTAILAVLSGASSAYRRRRANVYQQFMTSTYTPAGASVLRWSGYMDAVTVERSAPKMLEGGATSSGTINLECSRAGVSMSRRTIGLRSTHQQQIARSAGDMGLEYQQKLLELPAMWLSKEFMAQ